VGVFGFLVDIATVYTLRDLVGLYVAGMISCVVAATANWAIHRAWTFKGMGTGLAHRQWLLFLSTNLGGFGLNHGAYAALIFFSPLCHAHPALAIADGAGMFLSFHLSHTEAFR
jgi:putative flippase GtrA